MMMLLSMLQIAMMTAGIMNNTCIEVPKKIMKKDK